MINILKIRYFNFIILTQFMGWVGLSRMGKTFLIEGFAYSKYFHNSYAFESPLILINSIMY
jgi:hypothetical protein